MHKLFHTAELTIKIASHISDNIDLQNFWQAVFNSTDGLEDYKLVFSKMDLVTRFLTPDLLNAYFFFLDCPDPGEYDEGHESQEFQRHYEAWHALVKQGITVDIIEEYWKELITKLEIACTMDSLETMCHSIAVDYQYYKSAIVNESIWKIWRFMEDVLQAHSINSRTGPFFDDDDENQYYPENRVISPYYYAITDFLSNSCPSRYALISFIGPDRSEILKENIYKLCLKMELLSYICKGDEHFFRLS